MLFLKKKWSLNNSKLLAIFLLLTFVYLWMILKSFQSSCRVENTAYKFNKIPYFELIEKDNKTTYFADFADTCSLPDLNPWDPSILKFLNPSYNPLKTCKPNIQRIAKLENERIIIDRSLAKADSVCSARCLFSETDRKIKNGPWVVIDVISPIMVCDVVEVQCTSNGSLYYNYLFSQTVPIADKDKRQNKNDRPNVFIFVIDSTSSSSFIRTMPKTREFFLEELKAVEFRHLNRVDYNSMPNSKGFLIGKRMHTKVETPMNTLLSSDYNDRACYTHADNDSYIAFDFQKAGYITCQSEQTTVFAYTGCVGFKRQPTDHYWRPFSLRTIGNDEEGDHDYNLMNFIYNQSCLENYHHHFRHLDSFFRTYSEKSKFLMSWFHDPPHGDVNGLFRVDWDFYTFFKSHKKELEESYIFLMGDHGLHYTDFVYNDVGHAEMNNPFLLMSLPKRMRNNYRLEMIRRNSKELISHFDIHATLVDIVDDYLDSREIRMPVYGSSLFRDLPQPRSCNRLHIPFEFCGCQIQSTPFTNPQLGIGIGRAIVNHMNQHVERWFSKDKCADLSLDESYGVLLEKVEVKPKVSVLNVKWRVQPGNVDYSGYIWIDPYDSEKIYLIGEPMRLNFIMDNIQCTTYYEAKIYCVCA